MKKVIILLCILIGGISTLKAMDGCNQHLTPEEFRAKQQAYITEKAELTAAEATMFFPAYFELADKKKELNEKVWKLMHKGKEEKTTDEEYEKIILEVYDLRIESDKLEKSYYEKFKKVLSPKKIYMVQRAEARFQRELLKGIHTRVNAAPGAPQPKERKGRK